MGIVFGFSSRGLPQLMILLTKVFFRRDIAKEARKKWEISMCAVVLVCWCAGVLACWCAGVLVCWCSGVSKDNGMDAERCNCA